MVQPKYSPQDALDRIKLMMKYDSSKTLNENRQIVNEDYTWLLPNGTLKSGKELMGKIPKGSKAFTNLADAEAAAAELAGGAEAAAGAEAALVGTEVAAGAAGAEAAAGGGLLALASNPVGWAIGGTLAAAGLGYWLYDSINNGMPTAEKVKSFLQSCSTQYKNLKPTISDSDIISAAEKINTAIEGLGTDENAIKSAIESMPTVADLCALKVKYDYRYGDLYEDIDDDIDGTDWKTYVWAPMATIIEKAIQEIKPESEDCKKNPNQPKCKKGGGYKECSGTYSYGCKSNVIAKVQGCLGLVTDGKFGPKTRAALSGKGFTSFTDADVDKICNKEVETKLTSDVEISDLGQDQASVDTKQAGQSVDPNAKTGIE